MFRKQSKISKELYQPLSRQNAILFQSKYTLYNNSIQLKPSIHSCTISTSERIYYKNSVAYYHTNNSMNNRMNNNSSINIKYRHRNSCECYLCDKSKFHSSSHLYQQEQLQQETHDTDIQETESTESTKVETQDIRKNVTQQTEESRNTKIDFIVDEIAKLNLLEVATLVSTLKTRLNLPDTAIMGSAMPTTAMPAASQSAAGGEQEAEPEITQTIFDIVLKAYPQDKKVSVIKEVRGIYKLGLKEAKALVEKAPCTLQTQAPKVEADEIKTKLEAIGAEIQLD